jgi:glycosyltransferase involved in cell wall biosynthesis
VAALSITIVTPTLNAAHFIAECLASVSGQVRDDLVIEHLVIDGGSVDETEQIVRNSSATWLPRPGLGQAAAINVGLRQAQGEVVAWLNADDSYEPGALAHLLGLFAAQPELDVVYGDCAVIDTQGKFLWRISPGAYNFDRLLKQGNYLAQPSVFLRRRALERVGLLDEALDFGMDYELWLRLRGLCILYVPVVLAAFRWHPTSKTSRNLRGNWHELLIIVRRHGGNWTPALVWAYSRARITDARRRVAQHLPGHY